VKLVHALLDKPGHESFGMIPIVTSDEGGQLRVLGLARASAHRGQSLRTEELEELVRAGHALRVDQELGREPASDAVALWLGDSFNGRAAALGLPPPPLPAEQLPASGGTFFVGPSIALFPYLDRWIIAAFRRFRRESDLKTKRDIARLMRWVLPQRPETLAAAWSSSSKADRELELQRRTFAHGKSQDSLREEHKALLSGDDPNDLAELQLVLFTGGTGVAREELAFRFAKDFVRSDLVTFRGQIDKHLVGVANLTYAQRKDREMDQGQAEVDTSPLALALSTLNSAQRHQNTLVVDGLRHRSIRATLEWLGPRKVLVVAVEAADTIRRERIKLKQYPDPDRIFRHATERDIPELTKTANWRLQETAGDKELGQILDSL